GYTGDRQTRRRECRVAGGVDRFAQPSGDPRAAKSLANRPHTRGVAAGASVVPDRNAAILPGATIGIFGGGQLGRMTAMAARSLGYRIQVLAPDPACPARSVVDGCLTAPLADADAAILLARGSDVV